MAPAIFQSTMDTILNGLEGVFCYFDDILIGGRNRSECLGRTKSVLKSLDEYNVKANFISYKEISYFGYSISHKGVTPSQVKVEAILKANPPRDLTSVRSFLGLLNFYSRFLPNLQSKLVPISRLLRKDFAFEWSQECQRVKELRIVTDACEY